MNCRPLSDRTSLGILCNQKTLIQELCCLKRGWELSEENQMTVLIKTFYIGENGGKTSGRRQASSKIQHLESHETKGS